MNTYKQRIRIKFKNNNNHKKKHATKHFIKYDIKHMTFSKNLIVIF